LIARATSSIDADLSGGSSSSQCFVFSLSMIASTISSATWTPWSRSSPPGTARSARVANAAAAHGPRPGLPAPRRAAGHLHERPSPARQHTAADAQHVEDAGSSAPT
jgi:hypothetical protein